MITRAYTLVAFNLPYEDEYETEEIIGIFDNEDAAKAAMKVAQGRWAQVKFYISEVIMNRVGSYWK